MRDVAAFALHAATADLAGTFNLTASGDETMEDFLLACRQAVGSAAEFEWITDEDWLVEQGVAQWTELPLWRTYAGAWDVDSSRARAAGFTTRPIADTALDTWRWLESGNAGVAHERAGEQGIAPDKEQAILTAWDKRKHE